jgi:hypothetical protein
MLRMLLVLIATKGTEAVRLIGMILDVASGRGEERA